MRTLIIENSRMCRQLLDRIFAQHGFENDICDSIEKARAFADAESYEVICINHHLQDGSGLDFVEYCNKHERQKDAAILFLTSDRNTVKATLSVQVNEVITKISLQQIADQISHFVDARFDPLFFEGKILFIEDSKTVTAVVNKVLSGKGYGISHYYNAEDAWQEFQDEVSFGSNTDAYDLVLTDINLEGKMSGDELVTNIRALQDARGFIPIVAITGDTSDKLRLSLYQRGINDFIQKPVMPEELIVRIGNLITNKRLLDKVHDIKRDLFMAATTDKLTGCHNRRSLTELSSKIIHQAQRHGYPVSLMVVDLDFFKSINDQHGHATGDRVLQAIGRLLNKGFREGDLVARFGGEEFVILLSHCNPENSLLRAEKLRAKVEALKPADLTVTCSIGVTTLEPGNNGDFESMFTAGDIGVYQAKEGGRNQFAFVALD
ncbi:MAG: diguanylate cyclase [Gammaproteobacteria bacterium]|nr:diguanylate cyclase [Gammaproteobacteria bacterium]